MPEALRPLCPSHRYVVLRQGRPVFTTDVCDDLLTYLWGRNLKDPYVALDYERPYPVDTPDLLAWIAPLQAAQGSPVAGS